MNEEFDFLEGSPYSYILIQITLETYTYVVFQISSKSHNK